MQADYEIKQVDYEAKQGGYEAKQEDYEVKQVDYEAKQEVDMGEKFWKNHRSNEDLYFEKHRDYIISKNIVNMRRALTLLSVVFLALLGCSPFFFKYWRPTKIFILMMPIVLIFGGLVYQAGKSAERKLKWTPAICGAFYVILLLELIGIDLYPRVDGIIAFFPIVIAVFPSFFILRFRNYLLITGFTEVVYCVADIMLRNASSNADDIFVSVVGTVMALANAWVLLEMRIEDGKEKSELKIRNRIDFLTGILNKTTVEDEIQEYISHKDQRATGVMMLIDVDNFKRVNDVLGHKFGDEVLAKVGDMLLSTFRYTDIIGRIGGDEFIVFLKEAPNEEFIERKCIEFQKKIDSIEVPAEWKISCSIGVSMAREETYQIMFNMADDAMYEAKSKGKNQYICYKSRDLAYTRNILLVYEGVQERITLKSDQEIVYANNGSEILSLLSEYYERIAGVIINQNMKEMNAMEVLRYIQIRSRYKDIPITVILEPNQESEKSYNLTQEYKRLGATATIQKPS